jgi:hypothetical protein
VEGFPACIAIAERKLYINAYINQILDEYKKVAALQE